MEEEKKNKLKKILSYIGCGIGCFILGLCVSNCANNKGKKASNVNNNTQNEVVQNVQHKEIQFIEEVSDNVYGIIFSPYDLNNCTWPHFASVLNDNTEYPWSDYALEYGDLELTFDEFDVGNAIFWVNNNYAITFTVDVDSYNFILEIDNVESSFKYEVRFYVGEDVYSGIKTAIQQDIEYNNQQYQQSIFGGLTESLVDFIGVIGSGFTSVFTIFYASGHITTFGTLSLIVVGVAITYFLFRFVIGLIRLRG